MHPAGNGSVKSLTVVGFGSKGFFPGTGISNPPEVFHKSHRTGADRK